MDINNNEDYEKHVRSNESIRDGMDGIMKEPKKETSPCRGASTVCQWYDEFAFISHNNENNSSTSNNNTSSEEFSRG